MPQYRDRNFRIKIIISQLQKTQLVKFRGKKYSLAAFFKSYAGIPQRIRIRGGEEVEAIVGSARLHVCAHNGVGA